jgi:hypothetical protein
MKEHVRKSWWRWFTHLVISVFTTVSSGHLLSPWLLPLEGAWLGAMASWVFYLVKELGDSERHAAVAHEIMLTDPEAAELYIARWVALDSFGGFIGPHIVFTVMHAIVFL